MHGRPLDLVRKKKFIRRFYNLSKRTKLIFMVSTLSTMVFVFTIGHNLYSNFNMDSIGQYVQKYRGPNKLLNITNYEFVVNPKHLCSIGFREATTGRTIINVVHSARTNVMRRKYARKTFTTVKEFNGWTIQTIFLLGLPTFNENKTVEEELMKEIQENQDIVIGNFIDTYRNMSYKHLSGYRWSLEFCPEAKFYLKSDDDVLVDVFYLTEYLSSNGSVAMTNAFYCPRFEGRPHRSSSSKWAVTLQEYSKEKYPAFCFYAIYITTMETIQRIYSVNNMDDFLWLDDVFVTGILRERVNKITIAPEKTIEITPGKNFQFPSHLSEQNNFVWTDGFMGILYPDGGILPCPVWNSILQFRKVAHKFISTCQSLL